MCSSNGKFAFHFQLTVSWCVLSGAEEQKCLDLAGNASAQNIRGTLRCVRGLNARDCMDKIKVPKETDSKVDRSQYTFVKFLVVGGNRLEDAHELQQFFWMILIYTFPVVQIFIKKKF